VLLCADASLRGDPAPAGKAEAERDLPPYYRWLLEVSRALGAARGGGGQAGAFEAARQRLAAAARARPGVARDPFLSRYRRRAAMALARRLTGSAWTLPFWYARARLALRC
jgi:hypothetical protein